MSVKSSDEVIDLILTLDYEVYGDGSGDVFETMINPTTNFLDFCKKLNIKSTIFFEIIEYLQMQKEWRKGNKMGYSSNPIEAIKNQLIRAHQEGHDVQLHIHPHWINAEFKNGKWNLDSRYWKLTKVPEKGNADFPLGLRDLLKYGRDSLNDILKPIDPNYECNIFRAGGYSITPSDKIVNDLKSLGFVADSSVIPGAEIDNEYYTYDFKGVSAQIPYWGVEHKVEDQRRDANDFFEFPVFAKKIMRIKKYDTQRIKIALRNKGGNLTKIKDKVEGKKNLIQKLKFFMEDEYLNWDFCLFSESKLNSYLKYAHEIKKKSEYTFHPIVLIGHSKEFLFPENFEKFIKKNKCQVNFLSLRQALVKIKGDLY